MKATFNHVIVIFILAFSAAHVRAADIAVVISSDAKIYQEALEGFREVVGHRISSIQTLKDNPATWRDELKKIRSTVEPDLVFVIGTSALQAVAGEITNIPVVHAMVFNPLGAFSGLGKNVIGIGMNPSAAQTASLIRELNPKYRRVGTMFDPSRSGSLLKQAHSVFEKAGLQLVAREIRSVSEIGEALKSLENGIDILWLWPDENFLNDEILQRIFLFSLGNKIPVLGLSERQTEIGALVSLSYGSAKDLGRQAGEAVNRILGDAHLQLVPMVMPRQTKLTVNLKTARKLKVDVPPSIIQRADNGIKAPVYRNGDWWVFRIKMIRTSGKTTTEVHRVTYNNEQFASDDYSFLSGGDIVGTPFFLPFASVYLIDPTRGWLDFPLVPGKTWSFRYFARRGGYPGSPKTSLFTYADAYAEVVGKLSHPIETPAGKFAVIEINRTDNVGATLTYYYSSQSQSVVKLRAQKTGVNAGQYELELIAHGNGGSMGMDLR